MRGTWKDRFGFWLERYPITHAWLFRRHSVAPRLYVNRINRHVVVIDSDGRVR